ncbi:MAG: hypothetical protein R3C18_27310 [Planctomycetaceae bacterium]
MGRPQQCGRPKASLSCVSPESNAARWRVRRVNRMAELCSIMYTNHWKTYWQTT